MSDIQTWYAETIGDWIDEQCPTCHSQMLGNRRGDKWCSLVGCDHKGDREEDDT